jgi:hypothetical protein
MPSLIQRHILALENIGVDLDIDEALKVVKLANEVLLEAGVCYYETGDSVDEEGGSIYVDYALDITAQRAAELYSIFVDRLVAANLDRCPWRLSFLGTKLP